MREQLSAGTGTLPGGQEQDRRRRRFPREDTHLSGRRRRGALPADILVLKEVLACPAAHPRHLWRRGKSTRLPTGTASGAGHGTKGRPLPSRGRSRPRSPPPGAAPPPAAARPPSAAAAAGASGTRPAPPASNRPPTGTGPRPEPRSRAPCPEFRCRGGEEAARGRRSPQAGLLLAVLC